MKLALILTVFVLSGLTTETRGYVQYELRAQPNPVRLGHPLIITARIHRRGRLAATDSTRSVGTVRLILTKPGAFAVSIFDNRVAGCRLHMPPSVHQDDGIIILCDRINDRYIVKFPSVTEDHVGVYMIEAPTQTPRQSASVSVGLVARPTQVKVSPDASVAEGQFVMITCSADSDAALPLQYKFSRMVNGERVDPPSTSRQNVRYVNTDEELFHEISVLEFQARRQDEGTYVCVVTNEAGSKTSREVNVVVHYPADTVTFQARRDGELAELTCTSVGGSPLPGLGLYNVQTGELLKETEEQNLAFKVPIHSGSQYVCKTRTNIDGLKVKQSKITIAQPRMPKRFQSVSTTNTSVMLQWESEDQTFCLRILGPGYNSTQEITGTETVVYNVTQLKSDSEYRFQVRAKNRWNLYSNFTDELVVRTAVTGSENFSITRFLNGTVKVTWFLKDDDKRSYSDVMMKLIRRIVDGPPTPTDDESSP